MLELSELRKLASIFISPAGCNRDIYRTCRLVSKRIRTSVIAASSSEAAIPHSPTRQTYVKNL